MQEKFSSLSLTDIVSEILIFFKEDGSAELLEWDDYPLNGESIEGETKEGMNYYLLNESTPYGSVFCLWEE